MNIVLFNQGWLNAELQNLGHNVITVGWIKDFFNITIPWGSSSEFCMGKIREYFEPDVLVYYDNSALPSINNIEEIDIPKIFLSVDTFHHLNWHSEYAKLFNLTLVAQKDYVNQVIEKAAKDIKVEWFPLWVNQNLVPIPDKSIDISFRGNLSETLHPERKLFFENVSKSIKVDYAQGSFEDIYVRSKIVLNQAVKNDVNFRVFEVLMSGALLMTPRIGNGLEDLLKDGESCVLYETNNVEDAVDKLRYYLNNDSERERIANNGRSIVLRNHSAHATAIRLEAKINKVISQKSLRSDSATFVIQTFMARSLWQLLRTDDDSKYIEPLEKTVNSLIEKVSNISSEVKNDPEFETTIIISDLICSDVLDYVSYKSWQNTMIENLYDLPYIKLVECAYSDNENAPAAMDYLRKLRYKLVQNILQIN
jgi:hypothetical protein